ncbi:hypothetical protein BDV18DRAFT_158084 [Aspergillus unguis]
MALDSSLGNSAQDAQPQMPLTLPYPSPVQADSGCSGQDHADIAFSLPTGDFNEQFGAWFADEADSMFVMDNENTADIRMDPETVHLQTVHSLWHSHISNVCPDDILELPNTQSRSDRGLEIDERDRREFQTHMQIASFEPTVPSKDSLNMYVCLYFAKAQPIFPVVHRATFRPCKARASLAIALCALGSLFTGSTQGQQQGTYFFERIHKATLLSWESMIGRSRDDMISIIHCATVAQVFGMLSGNPKLLLTADAFHGPPVSWARQMQIHHSRSSVSNPRAQGAELEATWRKWAYNEELLRVVYGLYIVDAELASILHHEPMQSLESFCLGFASAESTFAAPSAVVWQERYLSDMRDGQSNVDYRRLIEEPTIVRRIPATSLYTAYAVLQSISTKVLSKRLPLAGTIHSVRQYDPALIEFHQHFLSAQDPFQLAILWHTVFMETLTDFNLLEKAIGRDGCKLTAFELSNVTNWAASDDASRCIMHALMILQHIQSMKITSEPAIHVPRALFWAGIAILCYLRFGMGHGTMSGDFSHPELLLVNMEEQDYHATALRTNLCAVIDLLEHAGHWGIARKFAATLALASSFAFD